ncbi:MAG: LytR C-terminal domain-containing protein [Acidimicrobiales bacterium]
MTEPTSPEPSGATPTEPVDERRATVIGAVLVVAALIIGAVLLAKGFGDDGGLVTSSSSSDQINDSGKKVDEVPTTETTTVPVTASTVKVFVANASGKKGAAGTVAQVLTDQGFPAPNTGNAAQTKASAVYVLPGDTGQGALVATDLGLDPSTVAPMPNPSPVTDLKGATVLVIIGTDGKLDKPTAPTTTATSADSGSTDTTG